MKKVFVVILLLCLCDRLHAQSNAYDIIEKEVLRQPDDERKDSIFLNLLMKYAWYKPDSSLYYSQKQILLAKQLNSSLLESRALSRYGYVLGLMGNYPQGIVYLLRAEKTAKQLEDSTGLYWNYVFLTEIYGDQGDYRQARFYAGKFQEIKSHGGISNVQWFVRMARIFEKTGQLDSALLYGRKALAEEISDNGKLEWTTIPLTVADIYAKRKTYDSALHYYRITALLSSKGRLIYKDLILAYNGMADVYRNTGQSDSGFYYAYKSVSFSFSNAYTLGIVSTYHILYSLFREKGRTDSAIRYLEQTIALKDSLFNQQKEREVQNIAFNEQLRQQEAIAEETRYRNRLRLNAVLGISFTLLVIALLLFRNIRHKQKAKIKIEKAFEELKSTQAQLIQSEKMASLGELTAGIAHEIQNPLNFVNNFSEVNTELVGELKEEAKAGNTEEVLAIASDLNENLLKISHHGKRADAIVKNMLQHSQKTSDKKEEIDINALTDEYLRLSYHGLRAKDKSFNTIIETHFDPAVGKININPQDIGRVLLNLFNNAFYAVNEKKKQPPNPRWGNYEPTITVSTKKKNGVVVITVADNGVGIPEEVVQKIYQPFFTTKPTGEGTGLGLSLSYDIITKGHGGEMNMQTKEGEGSEFTVKIPLTL